MKLNYDILGNHIQLVDKRNSELITDKVLGINIDKFFMPSVANIIGTDLSRYKLLTKNTFACNPMHVGRDEKLPVALYKEDTPAIVSPAYFMFEIKKQSSLIPEFLMMWFKRREFDRSCWYHTDGSVRGGITWEEICRLEVPILSKEEQLTIIDSYNVIADRITLKKKINDNLESTAKTSYKNRFEDFEPYGGSQPKSWKTLPLSSLAKDIVCGKTPPTDNPSNYGGHVPFITIPDMHDSVYTLQTSRFLSEAGVATQSNKTLPENAICVSCIATVGLVCLTAEPSQTNQQINSIICRKGVSPFYVYLKMTTLTEYLKQLGAGGSTTLNVNKTLFGEIPILYPDEESLLIFHNEVAPIFEAIRSNQLEIQYLEELKNLVLMNLSSR